MSSAVTEPARDWVLGACCFCLRDDQPVQWCGHLDADGPAGPASADLYACAQCTETRYLMALADQRARDMAALPA